MIKLVSSIYAVTLAVVGLSAVAESNCPEHSVCTAKVQRAMMGLSDPCALVIRADPAGRRDSFSTVKEALDQCRAGDTLVLLDPKSVNTDEVIMRLPRDVTLQVIADEGSEDALTFVRTLAADANAAFVAKSEPWYTATVRETDGLVVMSVGLNDQAKPGLGEVDFNAADGTAVSVWPTNVKPGLVYGLGRSESPTGPFIVEEDGWVQADANRTLPHALTASKDGPSCFYRVIVR